MTSSPRGFKVTGLGTRSTASLRVSKSLLSRACNLLWPSQQDCVLMQQHIQTTVFHVLDPRCSTAYQHFTRHASLSDGSQRVTHIEEVQFPERQSKSHAARGLTVWLPKRLAGVPHERDISHRNKPPRRTLKPRAQPLLLPICPLWPTSLSATDHYDVCTELIDEVNTFFRCAVNTGLAL